LWSCQGKLFDHYHELCTKANNIKQTDKKLVEKVKKNLDGAYSHLGGNAFGRDKKGRVTKDDAQTANELQATGHAGGEDYNAYVYYHFEIAWAAAQKHVFFPALVLFGQRFLTFVVFPCP
jgi:hypothetical protein